MTLPAPIPADSGETLLALPLPPSDEKRLSKWAGPLQTFLEFLAEGGADEVKKLPGGSGSLWSIPRCQNCTIACGTL